MVVIGRVIKSGRCVLPKGRGDSKRRQIGRGCYEEDRQGLADEGGFAVVSILLGTGWVRYGGDFNNGNRERTCSM